MKKHVPMNPAWFVTSLTDNVSTTQMEHFKTTAAAPLAPARTGRETEMTTYTLSDVQSMRPCQPTYTPEYLAKLFAGRETVTLLDVFDAPIPDADKVWFAVQPGVITKMQIDEFLERTVTRAVTNHALNCGVPEVEEWAKKLLSGEDRSAAPTYAAADAAARAAARAARAAARAADAAERARQVDDLRHIVTREVEA